MSYHRIVIANNPDHYEAWPGIVQLENGDIIVTYRTSDTNTHAYDSTGRVVMRKSTDNGLTWGDEVVIGDVAEDWDTRTGNIGIYYDENNAETLIQVLDCMDNLFNNHHHLYLTKSVDGGTEWSEPVLLADERVSTSKPIQLSDGSLIIGAYKTLSNDYTLSLFKSTDYGVTWDEIIVNHCTPCYYNESSLIETSPGNILMFARWDTITDVCTATNYMKFLSTDHGETWDEGTVMDFPQYYPKRPSLALIGSDKILFSWNDEMWYNRWDISLDNGVTWHTGIYRLNEIVKGHGGSYPESIELANGEIATVGCTNGATSDVELYLIDKEDIISRLPCYGAVIGNQNIILQ